MFEAFYRAAMSVCSPPATTRSSARTRPGAGNAIVALPRRRALRPSADPPSPPASSSSAALERVRGRHRRGCTRRREGVRRVYRLFSSLPRSDSVRARRRALAPSSQPRAQLAPRAFFAPRRRTHRGPPSRLSPRSQVVNQGFDSMWASNNKGKLYAHIVDSFPEPESDE